MSTQTQIPFLPLTNFQQELLYDYVRKSGYSEGVEKLYNRLKRELGNKEHYAMNSKGEIAKTDDGEILEETDKPEMHDEHTYIYKGEEYTYQTRQVTRKGATKETRRLLLPSKRAVQDFFRKDEMTQIDRNTVRKNAGGHPKPPPSTGLKPMIPGKKPLSNVFLDMMRMPRTVHNGKEFSWLLVIIDGLTRMILLKEIHLNTELSTGIKRKTTQDDEDVSKKTASAQVYKAFTEFQRKINDVRKHHADKTKASYSGDLHVKLLVSDRGGENSLFPKKFKELQEKHKDSYNVSFTPFGRSNYNFAETAVRIVRRYMFAVNRAFQERVNEATEKGVKLGKTFKPDGWHTSQSTQLYDWVKDVKLVNGRLNTRTEEAIGCTPIQALLELDGHTHASVHKRIVDRAEKKWSKVKHNLRLPAFSPTSPAKKDDYVRLRYYKPGDMGVVFPQLNSTRKVHGKSASNNWSTRIYKIIKVRVLAAGARTFLVQPIDPNDGKNIGWLDRTQILKIDPATKLRTGRTIAEEDQVLNSEPPDESESEDEAPLPKRKTRSKKEKRVNQLLKQSAKDWTRALKNKEFTNEIDGARSTIERIEYRDSKFGWVAAYKDNTGKYDMEFDELLEMSKGEPWFEDEYHDFLRLKKFR